LRSLFRNAPITRELTGSGQINISGLEEGSTRFDPKSRRKVEDFLIKDEKPFDLSRLLVVKAGETMFARDLDRGINKSILKDYLSNQRTLDVIMDGIPANIQKSSWENGQLILGIRSGECRSYSDQMDKLKKADDLLTEVNEKYALGDIAKEKTELEGINALIEGQEKARRHLAYQKSLQIDALDQALSKIPKDKLEKIKTTHNQIQVLEKELEEDQNDKEHLEPECLHYQWLETAIKECESMPEAQAIKSDLLYIIPGILSIIASVVLAFLQIPWGALGAGFLALVFFVLSVFHYRSKLQLSDEITELSRIFTAFENRFNQTAQSLTDLKAVKEALTPKYYRLQSIGDSLAEKQSRLSDLQEDLLSGLFSLVNQKPEVEDAGRIILDLQKQREELEQQKSNAEIELARLALEPEEYRSEPVESHYDRVHLNALINQADEISHSIHEKENALQTLKQRVCDLTSLEIASPWEVVIDALRDHRDEVCQSMKEIKAKIGSGVLITEVVNEIREKQDESITKALNSPEICAPIKALTHTYRSVELQGDDIIVSSDYERFPLHNLSTGAQEQILLALRIGIASHILEDKQMFLILDDAFQHSDWQRREWMVDQMADLASMGWQIIYFAMDDHIKQLFEERIKPKFPDRYAEFVLEN
jgi:DNA repair exonuclease SbcCD ATPase subunit